MKRIPIRSLVVLSLALLAACGGGNPLDTRSSAERAAALVTESRTALDELYGELPSARNLTEDAAGVLVFPSIVKAGLGFGGETGNGVLFVDDEVQGYYNKSGASIGFQAGAQKRSEVIIFLAEEALESTRRRHGLEFGVDASAAVLDAGAGGQLNTSNIDAEILAFIFGQAGLMANASLEGTKVTELDLGS